MALTKLTNKPAIRVPLGIINDLSQTYIFDTVAAFKASLIEFPDGKIIHLLDRGADFTKITGTGTANTFNIIASTIVAQSIDLILTYSPNIVQFGAVGGNAVVDSGALNAALAASKDVTIPQPITPFIFSNIQIPRGCWLQGKSKYDGGAGATSMFEGDGVNPVFLCGDGNGVNSFREQTINGLNGDGKGQEVVLGRGAPNLTITNNFFVSTGKNTIDLELCFRSHVDNNKINGGGGGWAVHWIDNMNGCTLDRNTVTGGALGGAILVSLANASSISKNTIETSLWGIRISCDSGAGHGNSTALTIEDNYIEDCSEPLAMGLVFSVFNSTWENNYVGNTNLALAPIACVQWGRMFNCSFQRNRLDVHTAEDAFQLHFVIATGDQEENTISNNNIFGTPANVYTLKGAFGANGSVQRTVGWQNYYDFIGTASSAYNVVFESGVITANIGMNNLAFNDLNVVALGGKVNKVEVFEKQGVITSTLTVGRSASSAEVINVDPETLSFTDGRADATLLTTTATVRSTESATYRSIAGVGTGTFRVRITYRVS